MQPSKRPAEYGGVAFALAAVLAYLLGVTDQHLILAFAVLIGFVPAVITWLVSRVRTGRSKRVQG